MSTTLTYVWTCRTAFDLARDTGARAVVSGADREVALPHLTEGRDVVATMQAMSTGVRLPTGTAVVFHEDCPQDGALRFQYEARDPRRRLDALGRGPTCKAPTPG